MRLHIHKRIQLGLRILLLLGILIGPAGAGLLSSGAMQSGAQLVAIAQAAAESAAKAEDEAKASKEAVDKSEASAKTQLDILQKEGKDAQAQAEASAEAVARAEIEIKKELEAILQAAAKAVENAKDSAKATAEVKVRVEAETKVATSASAEALSRAQASATATAQVATKAQATAKSTAQASAEAQARAKARSQATADAAARAKAESEAIAVSQAQATAIATAAARAAAQASAKAGEFKQLVQQAQDKTDTLRRSAEKKIACTTVKLEAVGSAEAIANSVVTAAASAEASASATAEAAAFAKAQAQAIAIAVARAQAEATASARAYARAQAAAEAIAKAYGAAESEANAMAAATADASAEATAKAEASAKARAKAEAAAKAAAEAMAKAVASAQAAAEAVAKAEAEAKAKAALALKVIAEAKANARAAAEAVAKALTEISAKAKIVAEATAKAKATAAAEARATADAKAKADAALEATKKAVTEGKIADAEIQAKAAVEASAEAWAHAHATADAWVETEVKISLDFEFMMNTSAEAMANAHAAADALAQVDAQIHTHVDATARAEAEASAKAYAAADALAEVDAQVKAEVKAAVEATVEAFAGAEAGAKAEARANAKAEAGARAIASASADAQAQATAQAEAVAQAQASATAATDAQARAKAWAEAVAFASARATASANAVASTFTDAQTSVNVIQKLDTTITEFTEPGCQEQTCNATDNGLYTLTVNALGPRSAATVGTVMGPIAVQVTLRASGKPDKLQKTTFSMRLAKTNLTLIAPLSVTINGKEAKFKEWQEGENASSSNSRAVTLDQDRTLTAIYEEAGSPELSVNPASLDFRGLVGTNVAPQSVRVTNGGQAPMTWTARAQANSNWLSFSPRNGTLAAGQSADVTVRIETTGLNAGVLQDQIVFEAPGARNSPKNVNVRLELTQPAIAELDVNPTTLDYKAEVGALGVPSQTFRVMNKGQGTMSWSVRKGASWVSSLSPAGGQLGPGQSTDVTVAVFIGSMNPGVYQDAITVEAPGARGTPKTVNIKLELTAARCPERSFNWAFGEFEGGSSGTRVRSFPSDLLQFVRDCSVQSTRQTSGQVPSGVTFALQMNDRTGQISGTLPTTSASYVLGYDLMNGQGRRAGTLTVTITVRQSGPNCPTQSFFWEFGKVAAGGGVGVQRSMPEDLRNGLRCIGAKNSEQMGGTLSGGLFILNVETFSGLVRSSPSLVTGTYDLDYDLSDASGRRVGTLRVRIVVGDAPQPTCCTLNFRAFLESRTGRTEANLQLTVNGTARTAPFTLTLPQNASLSVQAPPSVRTGDLTWVFDHWESNGQFLSRNNPLSGRTDKNETIAAIYIPSGGGGPTQVTLTIRAINTDNGSSLNVPIRVTTPSGTTTQTTQFSVTVNQGSSVTLQILQATVSSCATLGTLQFDRWTGLISSANASVTLAANAGGTITAEYRCK
jgi:hypothetical protein